MFVFLGGVGFIELALALPMAFVPSYFLGRYILNTALRRGPSGVTRLSVVLGLLFAPGVLLFAAIILGSIIFAYIQQSLPDSSLDVTPVQQDSIWIEPQVPRRSAAHPRAVALLTEEFYWSRYEFAGPFGSAHGGSVFARFKLWREIHRDEDPLVFLGEFLKDNETGELGELQDGEQMSFADNTTIALCLSQLILEGTINDGLLARTDQAVERQLQDEHLRDYGEEDYQDVRRSILQKIHVVLEHIES